MSDLISRSAALQAIHFLSNDGTASILRGLILSQKAVDAEPVAHGHWVETVRILHYDVCGEPVDTTLTLKCSRCGRETERYDTQPADEYCPRCGARMDGRDENK